MPEQLSLTLLYASQPSSVRSAGDARSDNSSLAWPGIEAAVPGQGEAVSPWICTYCARSLGFSSAGRVNCYAYREVRRAATECFFFVDLRMHPHPEVLSAIRKKLETAREYGDVHVQDEDNLHRFVRFAIERALVARGFDGASSPGLHALYSKLVLDDPQQ